jgi:hypothetical protein
MGTPWMRPQAHRNRQEPAVWSEAREILADPATLAQIREAQAALARGYLPRGVDAVRALLRRPGAG